MFGGKVGIMELLLIFALVLLVFGPSKLPQIGSSIGKGIREFRKASRDVKEQLDVDLEATEEVKS